MNPDKYLEELCQIRDALLESNIEGVSIRGENLASFIYAEEKGRAVEISKDDSEWWLEFWEDLEDDDGPPVKDEVLKDSSQVVVQAVHWLYRVYDATKETQHVEFPDTIHSTVGTR